MTPLTTTQQAAIARAEVYGEGFLYRWHGGLWKPYPTNTDPGKVLSDSFSWYASTGTARAIVNKGFGEWAKWHGAYPNVLKIVQKNSCTPAGSK